MTTATVGSTEQVDRIIVLPEAAPGGTTHHSIAIAVPSSIATREVVVARTAAIWAKIWAFVRLRWPLLVILAALSVSSLRLMMSNTAFLDEADYISAGHNIWRGWLHGGSTVNYPTYFSGAPTIYPSIAGWLESAGGLILVRMFSLACMLATTGLLYATTRLLYDRRAASWAAAVFATLEGAHFLAAFATYDAMSLMLIALSVWLVVRFALKDRAFPHSGLLLGAPVLAFANATKYASGLFDPVVVALVAIVVASRYGRPIGVRMAALFGTLLASEICAALALGGPAYRQGLGYTTINRWDDGTPVSVILGRSITWIGIVAALGIVAVMVAVLRWRVSRKRDTAALLLIGLLAGSVFLVPAQQARIHTTTSLAKHLTFGAWFTAIAVGWLLSRVAGDRVRAWWRWTPVLAGVVAMAILGRSQAAGEFATWPNMTQVVSSIRPYLALTHKEVLMDDADIASYYLGGRTDRWVNTYYFQYTPTGTDTHLVGATAYQEAIAHNYFGLVALHFSGNKDIDGAVVAAMRENPNYVYLGRIYVRNSWGLGSYYLWDNLQRVTS